MSGIPTPLDQTELRWRDNIFLQQFPLNQHTVLDYFSTSDFYDEACNNAECRRQGLNPDEALRTMAPGIEYVLTFVQEPSLYVIKRQYRTSPDSAIQQAFYYCLYGDIFQAPTLLACIQARTERCKYHMEQVFDKLKSDLEPLGWRTRHRNRKIKRAKRQHDTAVQNQGVESKTLDDERLDIEIARAAVDNGAIELNNAADGTGLENELEHEGAMIMAQPPPAPPDHQQWMKQTDNIIMNVLLRHNTPVHAQPDHAAAAVHVGKPAGAPLIDEDATADPDEDMKDAEDATG